MFVHEDEFPWMRRRGQGVFEELARLLVGKYAPAHGHVDRGYDFIAQTGDKVIELKLSLHGTRDLDAALLNLVLVLTESPHLRRATLVASVGRISPGRVIQEWNRMQQVIRPEIAGRLALVAVAPERVVVLPDLDPELQWLTELARRALGEPARAVSTTGVGAWTPKSFDVWMVLLDAWFRGEEPLGLRDLAQRSGCSYPTVASALTRLSTRGEITRTRNGRVCLSALPRRSLSEVLVALDFLRTTVRLADYSDRQPDPEALLRRIRLKATSDVSVGGVVAARYYCADFDLTGTPRLDLSLRGMPVPGQAQPDWLRMVDPALRPQEADRSPVLAIHYLRGRRPNQAPVEGGHLAFASPAETLLDLYELRLSSQADEFVQAVRSRGSHG